MLYTPRFNYKDNGIPILSYQNIDAWAEKIAGTKTDPDAADLKKVFSMLDGWHFAGRYLSKDGTLLGLTTFSGGKLVVTDQDRKSEKEEIVPPKTILLDRALFQERLEHTFRFVMAHEIGHALMHERFCSIPENMKRYSAQGQNGIKDDEKWFHPIDEKHRLLSERDWVEWQANAFASALLMPGSAVMQLSDLAKEDSSSELEYANTLNTLMVDVLKVSITAAFYRMKRLGCIDGKCILQNNGVISI